MLITQVFVLHATLITAMRLLRNSDLCDSSSCESEVAISFNRRVYLVVVDIAFRLLTMILAHLPSLVPTQYRYGRRRKRALCTGFLGYYWPLCLGRLNAAERPDGSDARLIDENTAVHFKAIAKAQQTFRLFFACCEL